MRRVRKTDFLTAFRLSTCKIWYRVVNGWFRVLEIWGTHEEISPLFVFELGVASQPMDVDFNDPNWNLNHPKRLIEPPFRNLAREGSKCCWFWCVLLHFWVAQRPRCPSTREHPFPFCVSKSGRHLDREVAEVPLVRGVPRVGWGLEPSGCWAP